MAFDYKELKKYCEGFEKATEDLENFLTDFLQEEGEWVLGAVKDRTPVDTGNLRRNWRITDVTRNVDTLEFELVNDADYASYIELGHTTRSRDKWIEGRYMATISIAKLEQRLPADFDKEFTLFLKRYGVL